MSRQIANVLGAMIVIVGLMQVSGFVLVVGGVPGATALIRVGQGTGASPLPTPFRDSNGYENFASYRQYRVTYKDASVASFDDHDFGRILQGPHRRVVPYFNALVMLPRMPQELTNSVLTYLFCRSEFSARHLHTTLENPVRTVEIQVRTKTVGRETDEWRYLVECLP